MSDCGGCGSGKSGGSLLTGPFTSYDPEKGIFCQGNFEDGVMQGEYLEFTSGEGENNTLLLQGGFQRGLRHGKWIQFKEDGSVKNIKVYVDGRLIEENE